MKSTRNWKFIIKFVLPNGLWPVIRRWLIVIKHKKVARKMKRLVEACNAGKLEKVNFIRKVDLPKDGKIIWQYWAQGYDKKFLPDLVSICLDSVEKYAGNYRLIRLTDKNISEYIDLPPFIEAKRKIIPLAQFSDLLRLMLLTIYGGIWLDASILLTDNLPDSLFKGKFFMYQRDPKEPHKKYWENSFAYYFGWYKGFRVNVLNGIMYADVDNDVIKDLCTMLLSFWKSHDKIPDYFFFQILFDVYMKNSPQKNCAIVNDCIPHMLRQIINAEYFYQTVEEVLMRTSIHSLSYKNADAVNHLRKIFGLYK